MPTYAGARCSFCRFPDDIVSSGAFTTGSTPREAPGRCAAVDVTCAGSCASTVADSLNNINGCDAAAHLATYAGLDQGFE
jgi:hypothetical protein